MTGPSSDSLFGYQVRDLAHENWGFPNVGLPNVDRVTGDSKYLPPHHRFSFLPSTRDAGIMSRAAKFTLGASILGTVCIITGVHYLQIKEREVCVFILIQTMYKGVQRDDEREKEKQQRIRELQASRDRESALIQLQPQSSGPPRLA